MSGIAVLISGRGSNLAAICNAGLDKSIRCVISNRADAPGLHIANKFNLPTYIIDHKQFNSREDFDREIAKIIDSHNSQYIILAGFMRILSDWFVHHYTERLVNIHPSLLPAFIGGNAIEQAFNTKVKISGVTIHFVTNQLDQGPIIAQGAVSATNCPNEGALADRIHRLEHILYPFIIRKLITGEVSLTGSVASVAKNNNDLDFLGEFAANIFY